MMELELGLQLLIQGLPAIAQIFTALQEERLTILKHEHTKEIHQLKPHEYSVQSLENQDAEQWHSEQKNFLKKKLAAYERETTLKVLEFQTVLENWPLKLLPSQLLTAHETKEIIPLKIFIIPPRFKADCLSILTETMAEIELTLNQGLGEFLSHHYPLDSQERPTEFLAGAWKNQQFHREASIKAIFAMLKSEPTLILESEIVGEFLNFRIAYWGLGQKNYRYQTIISNFPYWEMIYASVKNRALAWKETANKLLALGEDIEEISRLGGDNAINLKILEQEEKWKQHGLDTRELSLAYKISKKDFESLTHFLINCHCMIVGWVADAYHLAHYEVPPILPRLIQELTKDFDPQQVQNLLQASLSGYQSIFQLLEKQHSQKIPEIALKLAKSLAVLPDKSWAIDQVEYSIKLWLQQRNLEKIEQFQSILTVAERNYLENLRDCVAEIGNTFNLSGMERLFTSLQEMEKQPLLEKVSITPIEKDTSIVKIDTQFHRVERSNYKSKLENVSIIHTLTGHSGKAASIAVSFDGSKIASGSDDNTIKLWHLNTGELLRTFSENFGRVLAIALSPDGQTLASSHSTSDRSWIKIWHLGTGELLHTLAGHHKWIYSLAITPDGQTLVSGGYKIKTWHLGTGELLQTLTGHKKWVYSLAITPDGQTLVSSGGDKTIRIWQLTTGELMGTLTGHLDWIRTVAISPNGQMLASGSDDTTIKIWDLHTGKQLHTLKGHADWVLSLAISPDGHTLISGSKDNTIKLWHLETGTLLGTLTGHQKWVYSLAVSPDGQTFASGSDDKTIKIWRTP